MSEKSKNQFISKKYECEKNESQTHDKNEKVKEAVIARMKKKKK